MINLRNFRNTFRHQSCQNQSCPCTQVGRHHLSSPQYSTALDDCLIACGFNACAHLSQLAHMHEPVFKYRLDDSSRTLHRGEKGHERRLNVCRKARIRQCLDIRCTLWSQIAPDNQILVTDFNPHTAFPQLGDNRLQMIRYSIRNPHVASGNGSCKHKGSCFDPVRNHSVLRTAQMLHAFDFNGIGTGTLDLRSHLVQKIGQVYNFRLLCGILDIGDTFCQDCRHHDVLRRTHTREVQIDGVTDQTLSACPGFHIAFRFIEDDFCPQSLQSFQVQINGTGTDGTAAGQRHPCSSLSGKQRPHDENGSTHLIHQIKPCLRRYDILCDDRNGIFLHIFDFCTERCENLLHKCHITKLRHIADDTFVFRQQRGCHERQYCILGPADDHFSRKRSALMY